MKNHWRKLSHPKIKNRITNVMKPTVRSARSRWNLAWVSICERLPAIPAYSQKYSKDWYSGLVKPSHNMQLSIYCYCNTAYWLYNAAYVGYISRLGETITQLTSIFFKSSKAELRGHSAQLYHDRSQPDCRYYDFSERIVSVWNRWWSFRM